MSLGIPLVTNKRDDERGLRNENIVQQYCMTSYSSSISSTLFLILIIFFSLLPYLFAIIILLFLSLYYFVLVIFVETSLESPGFFWFFLQAHFCEGA